jgi:hypothetical protein
MEEMIDYPRSQDPEFYKTLDALMLSSYQDCVLEDGVYKVFEGTLKINVTTLAIYMEMDNKFRQHRKFVKNKSWRNDIIKCGVKITNSSGKTYSYPYLKHYIDSDNKIDFVIQASYYFTCITQIVLFLQENSDNHYFMEDENFTKYGDRDILDDKFQKRLRASDNYNI